MITVGVIPLAIAVVAAVLSIILVNIKQIPILQHPSVAPVFAATLIVLIFFYASTVAMTSIELAEYELNVTDTTHLENISLFMGVHVSITTIILWPLIILFASIVILAAINKAGQIMGGRN